MEGVAETVNLVLVFLIPFLILLTKLVSKLAPLIANRSFKLTDKEVELMKEVESINAELKTIPMVDEFAKYAKLQRKLNQITIELESGAQHRVNLKKKLRRAIINGSYLFIGIIYAVFIFFVYGVTSPVLVVSSEWFRPLSRLLMYPTGIPGAISIPTWTFVTRTAITHFLK